MVGSYKQRLLVGGGLGVVASTAECFTTPRQNFVPMLREALLSPQIESRESYGTNDEPRAHTLDVLVTVTLDRALFLCCGNLVAQILGIDHPWQLRSVCRDARSRSIPRDQPGGKQTDAMASRRVSMDLNTYIYIIRQNKLQSEVSGASGAPTPLFLNGRTGSRGPLI